MMKNSSLLKWNNNKNNNKNNINKTSKSGNKNWIHPPEALQKGHIAYTVKFLGKTTVDEPKGLDVVKEGIRKLKFSQQLRKSEGTKTPKVELTISVDGVAIQEPKSKKIQYQHELHRISYCADDKSEKRFFSYIAKDPETELHTCFVFVSDKLAEEITLTIGQAFDLAYRRFLDNTGKECDTKKQIASLQKKLDELELENESLKIQLSKLSDLEIRPDVETRMKKYNITDENLESVNGGLVSNLPPVPPRNIDKMNNSMQRDILTSGPLCGDSDDDFNPRANELNGHNNDIGGGPMNHSDDEDFDPRAGEGGNNTTLVPNVVVGHIGTAAPPPLLPPPRPARPHEVQSNGSLIDNIFETSDPFTPNNFTSSNSNNDILSQFNEMKAGFSRGLSFGTADDDFTLESLDPLKN